MPLKACEDICVTSAWKSVSDEGRRTGAVRGATGRRDRAAPIGSVSRLATESPARIVRSRRPRLSTQDTVAIAFAKILPKTREQIVGNVSAAIDGKNPDGVHQLRIGLRRLRSVLSLFRFSLSDEALSINHEARRALRVLGRARDLDVFVSQTLPDVLRDCPGDKGLLRLEAIAEDQRGLAYQDVRSILQSERFSILLSDIDDLSRSRDGVVRKGDAPLKKVACRLLRSRRKAVLKAGKDFASLSIVERHRVRISFKKLRYACDYFQSLYPAGESQLYLEHLKCLQEDLGLLNDASVAIDLAHQLTQLDSLAAAGAHVIETWYGRMLTSREQHLVTAWEDFKSASPFWS